MILDRESAKYLLSHLASATKKIEERDVARERLAMQVEKIKEVSLKKGTKTEIDRQLKEFEKSLFELLKKEGAILHRQDLNEMHISRLDGEIKGLEKNLSSIIKIDSSFDVLKKRISEYAKIKEEEKRTIEELKKQKKVVSKKITITKKPDTTALKKSINKLKASYGKIKKDKNIPKNKLKIIEERIKIAEGKLNSLKKK